ncbi:hypothetical protein DL95DRAFT_419258 [Leptodontidium sp. 2 PMI_412]|nr:hypothetical protein DL95DRAFT_419258 [Leptodontidium sp. 2 PMI_412]
MPGLWSSVNKGQAGRQTEDTGTRFPEHVHHPLKCTTVLAHTSPTFKHHKMVDEQAIKAALAAIEAQGIGNYRQIAKEHKLVHTTLMRRWKGETRSRADFQSEVNQNLTNEQERLLIKQINNLTARSIPPTSQMVKNFAEEMMGRAMGKN